MATSIEVKSRLREFLADPRADKEFRQWFASLLIQPNDPDVEALLHTIHMAFADAAGGVYSPKELRSLLEDLADDHQMVKTGTTVLVLDAGKMYVVEFDASQASSLSASGAFVPAFCSKPEPVSFKDDQSNFWGTPFAEAHR